MNHDTRKVWTEAANGSSASPNSRNAMPNDLAQTRLPGQKADLSTEREVSSIPRSHGAESESQNWVYPSQQMFFDAMRRKKYDPKEADMETVVPIHNAVNERAWREILEWENGKGSKACGGPKLVRFEGDSKSLSLKARMLTIVGYKPPFDKHEWVIDRCGHHVTYIIDFYTGKQTQGREISFYLDVRPKGIEGAQMRVSRWWEQLVGSK